MQTQCDQWQATAREHEEQAQAVHEELRTTRLAFQEQQAVYAPSSAELVGLRQLVSPQHAELALFSDTDQQVREVVRLQAEHHQAVQQRATLQQQTRQLTAERTAWLEEQAQLRRQLRALQPVADVLAQVRTVQQASLASLQDLRTMPRGRWRRRSRS